MIRRAQLIMLGAVTLVLTLIHAGFSAGTVGTLATPYKDPTQFTSVPFERHSHWLQPWRAYMETVPATTFLNGIGIVWNVSSSANQEVVAQMLAKNGIHRARVEVNWGDIDLADETQLLAYKAAELRERLLALKKYKIRPLILLNAHQGVPGPLNSFNRTITADAHAGDLKVQLDNVRELKVGYSGLSNLTDYWAAESLITSIIGNTVTLSKPLPKAIKAGTVVPMATLKYRPFSAPQTEDYKNTIAGWQHYVCTVAKFVASVLKTTSSTDKGFDMEIWNELTFGSNFLYINNYYAQKPYNYQQDDIWINLVRETAAYVDAHANDFQGVLLSNGFSNTIPWSASSLQPKRIAAINKHPYRPRNNYPQDESKGLQVNALHQVDTSKFIPNYSALFPEYFATALTTETIVRDMGPIVSDIYGTKHGRNARVINGTVIPTPVWITEVNISPSEDDPNITAERALAVKAKTTARYFCFFLNKGATQVHLFDAAGGDRAYGLVKQSFLEYAGQPKAKYPEDDTSYTSPALTALGRIVTKMSQQVDSNLTNTRSLTVVSISDTHNHYQFAGDGTTAHPNLYDRDVFAFLPFQVNARRFIIPYYVMTRDVMKDMQPEQFRVQIKGVKGNNLSVTAYDPLNDRTVPVEVNERRSDALSLKLTATDYPYLLTIQEVL